MKRSGRASFNRPSPYTTRKRIRTVVNNMAETKRHVLTLTDNQQISHNNFVACTNSMLSTNQGDDGGGQQTNARSRDGRKIYLKGVAIRMMLENKVDRTEVTYRLMVIKSAKGDIPTKDTLFQGISGNKLIDYVNVSRYTILFNKYYKIKAPNQGTSALITGNGTYATADALDEDIRRMNPGTRLIKEWIPFNNTVTYREDGTANQGTDDTSPKFFDYHVLCYAYDHFGTPQDVNVVGIVNEYCQMMYFKDI